MRIDLVGAPQNQKNWDFLVACSVARAICLVAAATTAAATAKD